jgi:hypothetical protein
MLTSFPISMRQRDLPDLRHFETYSQLLDYFRRYEIQYQACRASSERRRGYADLAARRTTTRSYE